MPLLLSPGPIHNQSGSKLVGVGSSAPGLGNQAKRYTDLLMVPDGNILTNWLT